ncbi:hypothetical protein P691DRAFT_764489 [Macrolepiota fuliginosa MF-IS2]|uniref:Uncharacterized protein n=1 Tax=Macrolepiota fuliginosa MF-IS2 TaxID=1400762 RepID=A0A9P5X2C0_9AGAR|nr:hypothetical protein P691DRAFT_764489 [Macrolepiota fuliginosa MF-IS2]
MPHKGGTKENSPSIQLQACNIVNFVALALILTSIAPAFPAYSSLVGLPREELDKVLPTLEFKKPAPPPGPPAYHGTRLAYDKTYLWKAPGTNDLCGPCPGFHALRYHGVTYS